MPKFPVPISDGFPESFPGKARPIRAGGYTLLETMLAVGLLALIAVTFLHGRAVMLRAELRVRRLTEARLMMREAAVLYRGGFSFEEVAGNLPEGWRLTSGELVTDGLMCGEGATNRFVSWRIWRLESDEGPVALDFVTESRPAAEEEAHE